MAYYDTPSGRLNVVQVPALRESDKAVLCIHGFCCDARIFGYAASKMSQAGYDVYGVIDASGTWSPLDQQIAIVRLVNAGAVVMNTANLLTELQYNHLRPTDEVSGRLFGDLVPALYYTGTQLQQHAEAHWRK